MADEFALYAGLVGENLFDELQASVRWEEVAGGRQGQVLVRVAYAGVNPADWKNREGLLAPFRPYEFPYIIGFDAAGFFHRFLHCPTWLRCRCRWRRSADFRLLARTQLDRVAVEIADV